MYTPLLINAASVDTPVSYTHLWRNFAAHRMAQEHGRMNDFADYKITVVTPVRSYTMMDRTEAPADSNEYLAVRCV